MEPLNKKERANAFKKVIGFFVLSFALAIFVGFTTMNVNKLAESKSMNELKKLKDNLKFQQDIFAPNIDQATKIMAKVPVAKESGENSEILHQDIATLLSTTKNSTSTDESWESKMYQNILKVYSDLQLAY
ncbi:MAG TPA: type VI secretion system TssO, partial [Prolixibacteraceae bacterium]|nr:type VI secretion system TssO [Prolixibacteraceae bacterium]